MTRGLAEIARLGRAGRPAADFIGLAGMGDLLLTCTGDLSRNRKVGLALAEGKKLSQILADLGHVAEGVSTAREVARLAERIGIEMPITQVVAILYRDGNVPAAEAVEKLLSRDPKSNVGSQAKCLRQTPVVATLQTPSRRVRGIQAALSGQHRQAQALCFGNSAITSAGSPLVSLPNTKTSSGWNVGVSKRWPPRVVTAKRRPSSAALQAAQSACRNTRANSRDSRDRRA